MGSTTQFLAEVEAAIGKSIPAERRAEILAETSGHLEDRAEDLAFGGAISQEKAEQEALNAFGSAKAYARQVTDGFYEDSLRRRWRKIALVSALLCIGLPVIGSLPGTFNLLEKGVKEEAILWMALTVILSGGLGILGRRAQIRRISELALCLFLIFFAVVGRRDLVDENGQLLGQRKQMERSLINWAQPPSVVESRRRISVVPTEEAQRVFTSPEPIPASWRLANGNYPVPPPREEIFRGEKEIVRGSQFWRSKNKLSATYSVRSEQEARQRWRADGMLAVNAERQNLAAIQAMHERLTKAGRVALAKQFHPMAALVQIPYYGALWLLVVLCDALGAILGRWGYRRNWKRKPTVPRKGAAA